MRRKRTLTILFFFIYLVSLKANTTAYNNGNGTVLNVLEEDNKTVIFRKHTQSLQIGNRTKPERLIIYKDIKNEKEIGRLKSGDLIEVNQYMYSSNIISGEQIIQLKIKTYMGIEGWILLKKGFKVKDIYQDELWSIDEKITINNEIIYFRKLEQSLSVWETSDILDSPSFTNSNVKFQLKSPPNVSPQINFKLISISDKKEEIDGKVDYWLKIKDKDGRIGYVFGGLVSVERGGSKYLTPENIISMNLAW